MDHSIKTRAIVSVEDPALDRATMDVAKYARTRDEGIIAELPGQRAQRYHVRRLTRAEMEFIDGQRVASRVTAFIVLGLVYVERPNGDRVVPTRKMPSVGGGARTQDVWDETPGGELDALYDELGRSVWFEIASVIENMAGARVGEAFGSSEEIFSLLPSSESAMARLRRSAVQART